MFSRQRHRFLFRNGQCFSVIHEVHQRKATATIMETCLVPGFGILGVSRSATLDHLSSVSTVCVPVSRDRLHLGALLIRGEFCVISSSVSGG